MTFFVKGVMTWHLTRFLFKCDDSQRTRVEDFGSIYSYYLVTFIVNIYLEEMAPRGNINPRVSQRLNSNSNHTRAYYLY